jgi:hypothetical protein
MVVALAIVAWRFYCGQAGTNRRRGLGKLFLPVSPSFLRPFRCLVANPLYALDGFIVPRHFQRKRIEIIWGPRGMVTYGALLSVNYLLIILFIFATTTASGVSEIVPLKFSEGGEEPERVAPYVGVLSRGRHPEFTRIADARKVSPAREPREATAGRQRRGDVVLINAIIKQPEPEFRRGFRSFRLERGSQSDTRSRIRS